MDYEVVHEDDVPAVRLSEFYRDYVDRNERKVERYLREDDDRPDIDVRLRPIDEALGIGNAKVKLWRFEEGDEIEYHAHAEQEEVYYVLDGEFSLKLGPSGETEIVEVGPGTFFAAGPGTGHGHRCISGDGGVVLAIGAPPADDPGLDPHRLD